MVSLRRFVVFKGKFIGQKPPLKLKEIWAIRIRLQLSARTYDLAIFNLAIDSKSRACDLTKLRVRDICHGQHVMSRATVMHGTHTMRRTKALLIYRRTKNLRAVQLLLGHSKLDYLPRGTMSGVHGEPPSGVDFPHGR
ncbi:hypothetical protein PQR53_37355 [Paraburkholderia fungorum]|uniref:hypothetical protein n=1 Tax=Paraburkholderia fungorum TaxID=134537 RepID=UPI0038BAFF6B